MILPVPSATAAASRHGFWTHHKRILRSLRVNARQSKIYHFVANFQTMLFISTLLGDNQSIINYVLESDFIECRFEIGSSWGFYKDFYD